MTGISRLRNVLAVTLLVLAASTVSADNWDANNYPNPMTVQGAAQCNMKAPGNLCDPDNVLSEQERYRLSHELGRLESRTRRDDGSDFCDKKGVTAVIGLAKNVRGNTDQDVQRMATNLRQRWGLDQQCQKGVVLIADMDNRKYWVSRDSRVPVSAGDFDRLIKDQEPLFQRNQNLDGLLGFVDGTADSAANRNREGGVVTPVRIPVDRDHGKVDGRPRHEERHEDEGWSFPWWLLIPLILLPLLLCCCLAAYLVRRKKNKKTVRRQTSADDVEHRGSRHREGPPQPGDADYHPQRHGIGDRVRALFGGGGHHNGHNGGHHGGTHTTSGPNVYHKRDERTVVRNVGPDGGNGGRFDGSFDDRRDQHGGRGAVVEERNVYVQRPTHNQNY